jgi:hypothetical protein
MPMRRITFCVCLLTGALRMGATVTVSLTPNPAGPQPVGTSITWTAMVTDLQAGAHSYRFSVQAPGGRVQIRKDFST